MSNNTSILEISKIRFIENPSYDNYKKLLIKIDGHKEIFDNKFFAEALKKSLHNREVKGLLYISQLYIALNRNVEAEYILFCAYEIDKTNDEILYCLFDILCKRKQLGLVASIGEKIDKSKNELMYVKALIKFHLLTNRPKELDDTVKTYFKKYKNDIELVRLLFIAAIQNDNYQYTYMVSKTVYQQEFFSVLTGAMEHRIKHHFYLMIINLLRENNHDNKNC